ncbi:MAG: anti-sigma factor [Bacteroidia bacterium]
MNIQEYISSGIVESYVLGLCNEAEKQEMEKLLPVYPELQKELKEVETALGVYAKSFEKSPSIDLKNRIFNQIEELENTIESKAPLKQSQKNSKINYAIAASIGLFVISFAGNIYLYNKWNQVNNELVAVNANNQVLADNQVKNLVRLEQMQSQLAIINDLSFKKVDLISIQNKTEKLASIYWSPEKKEVYFSCSNLKKPENGNQYQLWAIVDGKPVDAGMIPVDQTDSIFIKMKDFSSAQAFAITLEKLGGSESPNLEKLQMMGGI